MKIAMRQRDRATEDAYQHERMPRDAKQVEAGEKEIENDGAGDARHHQAERYPVALARQAAEAGAQEHQEGDDKRHGKTGRCAPERHGRPIRYKPPPGKGRTSDTPGRSIRTP